MKLKNSPDSFGFVAKLFHWVMATIILCLLLVGLYMGGLDYSPFKLEVYALHKSFGLLVLWLVGLRLIWRLFNKQPQAHKTHNHWERILAKLAHLMLYIAMFGMPLSGWLMSSAGEYPVPFFGIEMFDLVGKNPDLAKFMRETHEVLANILIITIFLHALGALKHHFLDRDNTLKRMTSASRFTYMPYVILIVLGLFAGGLVELSLLENDEEGKEQAVITQPALEEIQQEETSEAEEPAAVTTNEWKIVKDKSSIEFKASIYGKEFTGNFSDFAGKIIFDPENLENSYAKITIQTTSLDSADEQRDSELQKEEWFDISSYPVATFETVAFEKSVEGQYIAVGNLTIKDKTMPLTLPFTLNMMKEGVDSTTAYMKANITLDRLEYHLGNGQWESGESIGLTVPVTINLVATQNSAVN